MSKLGVVEDTLFMLLSIAHKFYMIKRRWN